MTINCEYCDSALDPLTGKCPLCEIIPDEDPNLEGYVEGEYVEEEADPLAEQYGVSDEVDPLE